MKKVKLVSVLIGSILSTASMADLSCEDQGYDQISTNVTTTADYVAVIAGQSSSTYTDGTIYGVDAVAYQYSLQNWNNTYKTQWCLSYDASLTSGLPMYGQPWPVTGSFFCSWVNEPSTSSDVTTIINVQYCRTKGRKLSF